MKPLDKQAAVMDLQFGGARVAMVGDGSTTPLLWRRPISGSRWVPARTWRSRPVTSHSCAEIGGHRGRDPLEPAHRRTIKQNLFWAFACNSAAIPLAMAGLLTPMVAGAGGLLVGLRRTQQSASAAVPQPARSLSVAAPVRRTALRRRPAAPLVTLDGWVGRSSSLCLWQSGAPSSSRLWVACWTARLLPPWPWPRRCRPGSGTSSPPARTSQTGTQARQVGPTSHYRDQVR